MTLGEYIKEYRKTHCYSMDEFARMAGLSKAYVSILERGYNPSTQKPAIPSLETIKRVASATSTDFNELIASLEGNQEVSLESRKLPDNIFPLPRMKKWKVIGGTACGSPIHHEIEEETILAPADIDADRVFRCIGDSMIGAHIFDGDLVFVKTGEYVEDGKIGVVRIGDEYSLKRIYRGADYLELRSENPAYSPIVIRGDQENAEIVGKAVHFLSRVI